ncbi:MAG: MBOAT family protein [Solobacterium sp.]|nr:MBOAT family protein [Solobacterium sp.]
MSVISLPYLSFIGLSAVLIGLLPNQKRKIPVLLLNGVFLYLLSANWNDVGYVLGLWAWTYLSLLVYQKTRIHGVYVASIVVPILGLAYYKYAGFFGATSVFMPLGISFYTFKAISYLVDVRQGKVNAQDSIALFDYLVFFPVFMAGPIHRSSSFFEQLETPVIFDYKKAKKSFVLILFGVVEKMVVADRLAGWAVEFLSPSFTGWVTVLGVVLYAFQLYADFDAYSNIAIGTAGLLGFDLERNFHSPYCAASIPEFWRRWHISLSSWIRDYVYIPLGGNRNGELRTCIHILIAFLVSGLWHGSTVLFLVWGLGHGVLNVLEAQVLKHLPKKEWMKWLRPVAVLVNFVLVASLWVFFRSASMEEALSVFTRIGTINSLPHLSYVAMGLTFNEWIWMWCLLGVMVLTDLFRYFIDGMEWLSKQLFIVRWVVYAALIIVTIIFGVYGPGFHPEDFIYVTF